jgi:hypothetical protein
MGTLSWPAEVRMPPSALARKLLIRPAHRVALMNVPPGYADRLQPLPDGAELVDAPRAGADVVQVFVHDSAELERLAPGAIKALKPDGLLWVCYLKGGRKAGTDLNRDVLWELMGKRTNLVGVSLVAVDDTWSAMRFRRPEKVGT